MAAARARPTIHWGQRHGRICIKVLGVHTAADQDQVDLRNDDRDPHHTILDLGPDDSLVLFGRVDVEARLRRSSVNGGLQCSLELSAAPVPDAAWPRLLAARGSHPRVRVDWSAWSAAPEAEESSDEL